MRMAMMAITTKSSISVNAGRAWPRDRRERESMRSSESRHGTEVYSYGLFGFLWFPNSCLGTGCLRNSVSLPQPLGAETEFRKSAFPNRSLGTREISASSHGVYPHGVFCLRAPTQGAAT